MTEMPKGLSLSTKVCEKMSEEQCNIYSFEFADMAH